MKEQKKFTNKKEPKRFWKWTTKQTFGYSLLFTILISFLYSATNKTIQNFQLERRGVVIKAFVVDKKSIGAKGTINFTLKYSVNGVTYQNDWTNEKWNVGDSVEIMYLTEDPNIIRSRKFIQEF